MKNDRHAKTAHRYGIVSKCENLEADLLKIPGVISVDFDLDGFYDNMRQVIFLVKYDTATNRPDYSAARKALVTAVIDTAAAHDLTDTSDRIEDYGEHLYFVRHCGTSWEK